jgi:GNAT superfamily N-acetyltransferase
VTSLAADGHEELEDGTRATTPDGDNLVLDYARTEAAAFGALVETNGGRLLEDDAAGLHLRDLGIATAFGNPALLTRPVRDADTEAVLERILAFYRAESGGPFLVFSPWRTTDWTPHGFVRVGHPPLMFRPAGGSAPTADGLRIRRASDAATLDDFERTLIEAYPVPEVQPWRRGVILAHPVLDTPWQLFVGYVDDAPVATAGAYVGADITVVEIVSTRPEFRGRGIGAAITAAATFAQPQQPAMLISSDAGRGVYGALGYLPLQRYTLWIGHR